jgi:hypothetical protein
VLEAVFLNTLVGQEDAAKVESRFALCSRNSADGAPFITSESLVGFTNLQFDDLLSSWKEASILESVRDDARSDVERRR